MFWSPADWAWTGGLFDVLLPTWACGQPLLGYRGRFDPEKAFWLMEKYGVRNAFLFPTALKMMMKAVPEPRARYDLELRSIMSAGESVGETVFAWARDKLGLTINEMFGQTEVNYIVGNCAAVYPPKPGAMGRPYPGHRVAVVDDSGKVLPPGEVGEVCVQRSCNGEMDPVFLIEYWNNPKATEEKYIGEGETAWARTGDLAKMDEEGYPLVPGPRRRHVQERRLPHRPGRDRELPGEASGGGQRRGDRRARRDARHRRQGLHRAAAGAARLAPRWRPSCRPMCGNISRPTSTRRPSSSSTLPMTTTGKVQRRVLRLREEEKLKR
jgi:acetyl-CoA synthetase